MNQTPYTPPYQPPVYTPPAPKPRRTFTKSECVFAWLSLLFGYLFCRVFPVMSHPLGGFLFVVAVFLATAVIMICKGAKPGVMPILTALSAIAISATLIISANAFLHFFAYLYAMAAYAYFVYAGSGNALESGFSNLILMDYFKALFVLPFYSFGELFRGMFTGKAQSSGKWIAKILIGVAIALLPTMLVLVLLSYDQGFSELVADLIDFIFGDIFSHLLSFAFGIPVGMYIFGLFVSSSDRKCATAITAPQCHTAAAKIKVVPALTAVAAVVPILTLYVLFFISQWKYYLSAFTGVLPKGFSYAEYAREGFFQLCAVSVINLLIIVTVALFMRWKTERPPIIMKILASIFSLFTLVLISTAVAKMVLYIDCYGLTQKRVYATWLMVVLALIFILIALRQFIPKLNAVAASLAVCVVLFGVLSLSNVDGLIARYNVDRYLDESLESVDVQALCDLGDAAIPEMVRLAETLQDRGDPDPDLYLELKEVLEFEKLELYEYDSDNGLFSRTLPSMKAEKALEEMELK